MSGEIKLDARLSLIRDMVAPGSVVADIGTDHGYLACALVESHISPKVFACDANFAPLEKAKRTITENCLTNSIDTVLTNGLNDLPYDTIDVFVIAGMGGDLIADILLSHMWTRDTRFQFILNPMTKAEHLRRRLFENGFGISSERCVVSVNKVYSVMSVSYTGCIYKPDAVSCYTGRVLDCNDFPSYKYLTQVIQRVEKKARGLLKSKNPEEAAEFFALADEIRLRETAAHARINHSE